jgi:poly(3-hydroxybutyrate) depolymerase
MTYVLVASSLFGCVSSDLTSDDDLSTDLAIEAPMLDASLEGDEADQLMGEDEELDQAPPPIDFPPLPETLGGERPATYILPSGHDPQVPAPLIILLHGFTGTAEGQNQYFRLSQQTEVSGAILLLPNGRTNPAGAQFWSATDYCCDFYNQGDDDVEYLLGLIEEIKGHLRVDSKRVALIGHSNGGFMSYRLACEASEVISHVVSLAGASWFDPAQCDTPSAPVSVLQIHGAWDLVIRYGGQREHAANPQAEWDVQGCWTEACGAQQTACAASSGCSALWTCVNSCGWDQNASECREMCINNAEPMDRTMWTEELVCGVNSGCTDDPSVAQAGYTSASESVQRWIERNQCSNSPIMEPQLDLDSSVIGRETTRQSWTQCDRETLIGLWTIERGNHVPPVTADFSQSILQWILSHPRQDAP